MTAYLQREAPYGACADSRTGRSGLASNTRAGGSPSPRPTTPAARPHPEKERDMGRNRYSQKKTSGDANTCRLLRRYGVRACSGCDESVACSARGIVTAAAHESARLHNDQDVHGYQGRNVADGYL